MIRGTKKIISQTQAKNAFYASIHNRFDVEVVNAKTGQIKQKAVGHNTICNKLWTRLLSNNTYFKYIHYGTGSGTPSTGDTSLFAYLGGLQVSNCVRDTDFKNGVFSIRQSIQLNADVAVGKTITEVGIAYAESSTTLCTHAMLKDMNDNPVSILKSDIDVINIYATIFVHFNPEGYNGVRLFKHDIFSKIAGYEGLSSTVWVSNHCAVTQSNQGFGGVYPYTGAASPNYAGRIGSVTWSYDVTNKKIIGTLARYNTGDVNIGGIRSIYVGHYNSSSYSHDRAYMVFKAGEGWFPYSEIIGEAVGTGDGSTVDFELDFPFAHSAKVYIDGVEITDFTLDYGPHVANAFFHLEGISSLSTPNNHIPSCVGYTNRSELTELIYYNPVHVIGLKQIYVGENTSLYASNDLESWELVDDKTAQRTVVIPEQYIHYKYWRGVASTGKALLNHNPGDNYTRFIDTFVEKKLHLTNPPPSGAVITVDYKTDTIAKDTNHVFDLSFEIQLGEYTEAQ